MPVKKFLSLYGDNSLNEGGDNIRRNDILFYIVTENNTQILT